MIVTTNATTPENPDFSPRNRLVNASMIDFNGPFVLSDNLIIIASHAEANPAAAPFILFSIVAAIWSRSPSTPVMASRNGTILSADCRKALNAATLRLSVSCKVVLRSTPLSLNFCKPDIRSGKVFTEPPSDLASFPLLSARFSNILRVAVAADDASNPESDNFPSNASVSSIVKLKALATGPTVGRASLRYAKDNALFVVAIDMADTYLFDSDASAPNILSAAPANVAASANPASVAWANFRTDSVADRISFFVNPSLASSVCKLAASAAVYLVVSPNFLALSVNSLICPGVFPSMADNLLTDASKSAVVLINERRLAPPTPITAANPSTLPFNLANMD